MGFYYSWLKYFFIQRFSCCRFSRRYFQGGIFKQELFPEKNITNIRLAPNGRLCVLFRDDKKLSFLNTETFQEEKSFSIGSDAEDIVFSPDGSRFYISLDTKIMVFDINKTSPISTINNLPGFISTFPKIGELAISPDGSLLCLARKNSILVIDTQSLHVINTFNIDNKSSSGRLQVLFTAPKFIYISEINGRNIYVLDLSSESNKPTKILDTKIGNIQSIKASIDRRLIYVSDFLGRSVIDVETQSFLLSGQDLIKVTDGYSLGIALAGDFSIGQAPALTSLSPSANQQVMPNQPLTIRWNTVVAPQSYSIASYKVELSTDAGATFNVIPKAEMLPAEAQEFIWQVPDIEVLNKVQI
ncbi:MAG: hypothetical protein FD167_3315, partial [bacterium]